MNGPVDTPVAVPHPIVAEVSLLTDRDEKGQVRLSAESLGRVREAIAVAATEGELRDALEGLVDLAAHLERNERSPAVANTLLELAREVAAEPLNQVHGIAAEASLLIERDKAGLFFPATAESWLVSSLASVPFAELDEAVEALIDLARHFGSLGDGRRACAQLLKVATTAQQALVMKAELEKPRNSKQPHPIAAEAALWLVREPGNYELADVARAELHESLLDIRDRDELRHATTSLIDLAAHMRDSVGRADLADALVDLAGEAAAALAMPVDGLHPIAAEAALQLADGDLDRAGHAALLASLAEIGTRGDLQFAVESLVDLARQLDHRGQHRGCAQLLEVAAEAVPKLRERANAALAALHPIAAEAALFLTEGTLGFPLSEKAYEELEGSLDELNGSELAHALDSLTALATHLAVDLGDRATAEILLELVGERADEVVAHRGQLHGIAAEAALLLQPHDSLGPHLNEAGIDALELSLAGIPAGPGLAQAVESLIDLAAHLASQRHKLGSQQLLEICAQVSSRLEQPGPAVPDDIHPIAAEAALLITQDGNLDLDKASLAELRGSLADIESKSEREQAIHALVDLSRHLTELSAHQAAAALLGLVKEAAGEQQDKLDLHPIVAEASLLLTAEGDKLELSARARAQIRRELERLLEQDRESALEALESLVDLGRHLQGQGEHEASNALLEIAAKLAAQLEKRPNIRPKRRVRTVVQPALRRFKKK